MSGESTHPWPTVRYRSAFLPCPDEVSRRQDALSGFNTAKLLAAKVLIVGAGGLGGHIGGSLVRKGVGEVRVCDHDVVEPSNLNRQLFATGDLHQPKALALAKNLAREGCLGAETVGHAVGFFAHTAAALAEGIDAAIVAIDNNAGRVLAARYFGERGVPVIYTAVDEAATFCWTFVQTSVSPCPACVFPFFEDALRRAEPCRDVPSSIDILKVAAGLVSFALDGVLMSRPRSWTYADFHLAGGPNVADVPHPRAGCLVCGGGQSAASSTDAARSGD